MSDEQPAVEPEHQPAARGVSLEYGDYPFRLERLNEEDGTFEGYAAVFGNEDENMNIFEPGSFKKTIRESKGEVPILWQHDPYNPIGVSLELKEDSFGLFTRGQLVLEVQRGSEARALMKAKAIKGLSIGYRCIKAEPDKEHPHVRRIKEAHLGEYSPVTFPGNPLARPTSVNSALDALGAGEHIEGYAPILFLNAIRLTEIARTEGRVLSRASRAVVEQAIEGMQALLATTEPEQSTRQGNGAAAGAEKPAYAATLRAVASDMKNRLEAQQ